MKVLFNARREKDTNPNMIVTCTANGSGGEGCGSILKIYADDILCRCASQSLPSYECVFTCPCCGQSSIITESIPWDLRNEIKEPEDYDLRG